MNRILLLSSLFAFVSDIAFAQNRWYSDYSAAKAEAKKTGKPIFLTIHCEPCEDMRKFDERVVRLVPEIAEKFIPVRLTRITGIDLNVFEFDYDLTWAGFFLNADEHVYGRYGGRDAKDPEDRLSIAGLKYAMQQAEELHKDPAKLTPLGKMIRAEDLSGAKKSRGCIHCHNVNEFQRAELKAQSKWTRDAFWVYPLPENIGLTLEIDRGNRVKKVESHSVLEKAGITAGDIVKQLNGYSIASFADAQFALHKAPVKGEISIRWSHDDKEQSAKIDLVESWRKTNLSWRPSLVDFLPSLPISGADLSAEEKMKLGLAENRLAVRQDKFVHSTLKKFGLQNGDIVVGLSGQAIEGNMKSLLDRVRSNYLVGDKVALDVLREGKPVSLEMVLK